jgi:hypothetical protein
MLSEKQIADAMLQFSWTEENGHLKMGRAIEQLVRDATLEEAAQVCDAHHDKARTTSGAARANACAEAIRARKSKPLRTLKDFFDSGGKLISAPSQEK